MGSGERRKDDKTGYECQDERGGERVKDDDMGCDVHDDQDVKGRRLEDDKGYMDEEERTDEVIDEK